MSDKNALEYWKSNIRIVLSLLWFVLYLFRVRHLAGGHFR